MKSVPQYIRDGVHEIIVSAVNLWTWAHVVEKKELPKPMTFWIRPRDMSLAGPQQLNGKVFKVTFEIEDEPPRPEPYDGPTGRCVED